MPIRVALAGFVNAYVVEEEDGLTVIDTGMLNLHRKLLAEAQRLGKPITRIALTHAHTDHVGALDKLAAAVPEAEVSLSARDTRILTGDRSLDPGEAQTKIGGSWPTVKTPIARQLQPGDTVGSLQAVAAFGHTPGQLAFLDPRDGTLYCGDAFSTLGGMATTAKGHWRFPLPASATWDKPTALETAKALRALDPKALAPGHGKVVENPSAAMDAAIARGL